MRDIILLVSLVAVSLAFEGCGRRGTGRISPQDLARDILALNPSSRYRSSDQVGKRQTIQGPLAQEAGRGEFPWQVLIKTINHKFECAGTLIEKNWVLTAAHCFTETEAKVPSNYDAILGAWRQNTFEGIEQKIRIKKIIRHENYDPEWEANDIALIQLAENADLSTRYVGTACLPEPGDNYQNTQHCWMSGWGEWLKPVPASVRPNALQKVKGQISGDFYVKAHWHASLIYPGMIGFIAPFVKGQRSGSCKGDSGGPVVCPSKSKLHHGYVKYDIVGIISWGPKDCKSGVEILSSVTHFLPWINGKLTMHRKV